VKLGNSTIHGHSATGKIEVKYIVPISASLTIRLAHVSHPRVTTLQSAVCTQFDEPAVTQVFPVHTAGLSHFGAYHCP
jgi:hypothetical protein